MILTDTMSVISRQAQLWIRTLTIKSSERIHANILTSTIANLTLIDICQKKVANTGTMTTKTGKENDLFFLVFFFCI